MAQAINYWDAHDLEIGLLIKFGSKAYSSSGFISKQIKVILKSDKSLSGL